MGVIVMTNAKILLDAFDLSGDLNELRARFGAEAIDVTTFGSGGTRKRTGGLYTFQADVRGLWQAGPAVPGVTPQFIDDTLFANLVLPDKPFSFADRGNEGDVGYFIQTLQSEYVPGAAIGAALAFSAKFDSRGQPLLRGTVLAKRTSTATGNAPTVNGLQVGAVSATQKLYAALHVFDPVPGVTPTLNVILQSSVDNTFASPTARITFAQAVAKGSQYATPVAGPITDAWWRANFVIGGSAGPSFPWALLMAIR